MSVLHICIGVKQFKGRVKKRERVKERKRERCVYQW